MSHSELNASRWLEAHSDSSAGLKTLPQGAILADIAGDGEHRLVLLDIKLEHDTRSRFKTYKGTVLTTDQTLPDIPNGIISFYADSSDNNLPAIGIACCYDLLIYKNNKPFFKFTVPNLVILPLESEVWSKLPDHLHQDVGKLVDDLRTVPYTSLTARSQKLLNLRPEEYPEFIQIYKNVDLKKQVPITCITSMFRNGTEHNTPSCPVIGTEGGQIYILDPSNFNILHEASVCSTIATPCFMRAVGQFDVEFRLLIATREGHICLLRRGWLEGKVLLRTNHDIIDFHILPGENTIAVATVDKLLSFYTKKGTKLWSQPMKSLITCLCLIPLKHLSTTFLAVGLSGGCVQLYKGRQVVDQMYAPDTPSTIIFGQMGQEEHVLVIITINGILEIKILKRTADFNFSKTDNNLLLMQNKPLPIPKRSKLFLEQSARERQNAIEMHRNFQQDLIRLRLNAAKIMVQSLADQTGFGNTKELVKLSAQVLGLGPHFTLILNLENLNTDKPLIGLSIIFHCRVDLYKLGNYLINLPLIAPGLTYKIETKVEDVSINFGNNTAEGDVIIEQGRQHIKVFCVRGDQSVPVIAATINMPPSDITIPEL